MGYKSRAMVRKGTEGGRQGRVAKGDRRMQKEENESKSALCCISDLTSVKLLNFLSLSMVIYGSTYVIMYMSSYNIFILGFDG